MTVTVYTKNNCVQCRMAKKFLTPQAVAFNEINVDDNPEHLATLKAQGHRQMPVVTAGDTTIAGFRPDLLATLTA